MTVPTLAPTPLYRQIAVLAALPGDAAARPSRMGGGPAGGLRRGAAFVAESPPVRRGLERGADRGGVRQAGAGRAGLELHPAGQDTARSGRINRPDYALFADAGDQERRPIRTRATMTPSTPAPWRSPRPSTGAGPSAGRTPAAATPGRPRATPATRWSATWWARAARGASSPTAASGASTAARSAAPPASSTRLTWGRSSTCRGRIRSGGPHAAQQTAPTTLQALVALLPPRRVPARRPRPLLRAAGARGFGHLRQARQRQAEGAGLRRGDAGDRRRLRGLPPGADGHPRGDRREPAARSTRRG